MMNNIEVLQERLKAKREAYSKAKEYFSFTAQFESDTSNFERNAIGELADMLKLKSEINELEFCLLILMKECTNCKWQESSETCNKCVDYRNFEKK